MWACDCTPTLQYCPGRLLTAHTAGAGSCRCGLLSCVLGAHTPVAPPAQLCLCSGQNIKVPFWCPVLCPVSCQLCVGLPTSGWAASAMAGWGCLEEAVTVRGSLHHFRGVLPVTQLRGDASFVSGHLHVKGKEEKMSKSLNNYVTIKVKYSSVHSCVGD